MTKHGGKIGTPEGEDGKDGVDSICSRISEGGV